MQSYVVDFDSDRFDADAVLEAIDMGDGTCVTEQDILDEIPEALLPEQLDAIGEFVRNSGFAASQAIGVALRKQDALIEQAMLEYKIAMVNGKAQKVVTNYGHARKLMGQGWVSKLASPPKPIHRYQGVA